MNFELVKGDDIKKDAELIIEKMRQDSETVFVYSGLKMPLYAYIEQLDKIGKLPDEIQFQLKICYEKSGLDLTYKSGGTSDHKGVKVTSIHQLVGLLDKKQCHIVVNNDERGTLADIVQQFIYIGYPLTKAEIMLKKDEKDRERANRFMKQVDVLDQRLQEAIKNLEKVTFNEDREDIHEILESVKESCKEIQQQMDIARNRQLKIAVAASKKTGKSVIVNSMIGEELAPTSLELATPNSCIYKKSDDGKYYLNYNGKKKHYISSEELHEEIGDEFKKAQDDTSKKFTLPDMEIGYVSDKNNFEAYTIYDTPGPDAAGTGHGEKAKEAMEQSDVAIFAIDYAKYLTTTEEEYLSQIKEQFNKKQKFNSLIFTINKVDERYNDANGSKSIIKSIDFIRKRLQSIDKCYQDCAIFATSALQYFYALEAERECGEDLKKAKDLYTEIRPLIARYKKVKGQLNFLDGRVGDMVSYSGLSDITLEKLKQYSGMPDLLEYTSYIARTKARDELINSVAYEIDLQQGKIQTIVDRIENIRRLVGESNEHIQEITKIFKEFEEDVKKILEREITEEDVDEASYRYRGLGRQYRSKMYWNVIRNIKRKAFTFENIKAEEIEGIDKIFEGYFSMKPDENLVGIFSRQIKNEYWEYFQKIKRDKIIVYDVNAWMTEAKVANIAKKIRDQILERAQNAGNVENLESLNEECEIILQNRLGKLEECIRNCESQLKKMDFEYSMPKLPKFSSVSAKSSVEDVSFGKMSDRNMRNIGDALKALYKKPNVFKRFAENIRNHSWEKEKYQADSIDRQKFDDIFGRMQNEMSLIVGEIQLDKFIEDDREQIKKNIKQRVDEISAYFNDTLGMLSDNIKIFTSSIDEREKYHANIEMLEEEEAVINQIREATGDFMDLWEQVCDDKEDLLKEMV